MYGYLSFGVLAFEPIQTRWRHQPPTWVFNPQVPEVPHRTLPDKLQLLPKESWNRRWDWLDTVTAGFDPNCVHWRCLQPRPDWNMRTP